MTNFELRHGYWKAMLDLYNFIQLEHNKTINSKKKYETFITTLLNELLTNAIFLDNWMDYGGNVHLMDKYDTFVKSDGTFFIKEKVREK